MRLVTFHTTGKNLGSDSELRVGLLVNGEQAVLDLSPVDSIGFLSINALFDLEGPIY